MNLGKITFGNFRFIFTILILAIIYFIIFFAIKVMYKDVKNQGRRGTAKKKSFGLEVISAGENSSIKKGAVIPVRGELTIGRKEDNMLVISDPYSSGHHARISLKNGEYMLDDLKSTNGTLLNGEKVAEKTPLYAGDEIKIGSCLFKVIS